MNKHDLDNKEHRRKRDQRHNERANKERLKMLERYEQHVTIISWLPLNMKEKHIEYLVRFNLDEALTPEEFLHKLVESVGGWIVV